MAAVASSLITVFIVADPSSHSAGLRSFRQATETTVPAPIPLATTFTVNSVNDNADANVGDGHCDTDGNLGNGDQCTLRAAIQEGAATNQGHSINFNLPAGSVIPLNTALPAFQHDVSIVGPGASQLTIQRSAAGGTPNFLIFSFIPINGNFNNSISGVTLANGNNFNTGSTFPQGGCLYNASPDVTTLTDVTFRGCASLTNGGGIYNGGTLTLTNSTVTSNTAGSAGGGGIYNTGTLTVTDSTISDNVGGLFGGGGILNTGGTATVTRSTVSGNDNGGIANVNSGATLTLTNSTVSGNTAFLDETGGIKNSGSGAVLTLSNSTVTANTGNGFIATGGIRNEQGTVNLGNSIVAKNTGALNDVRGTFVSQGYNLIGISSGDGLANGMNHDQVGLPGAAINPLLGPLANNGGATRTHAPLVGSPAIDAGNSSQLTDQRGQARPVDDPNVTNAAGGNATDIGAYETNPIQVNSIIDADDGQCGALGTGNGCTLREAVIAANAATSSFSDITFAPALTSAGPVTIDLLIPLPALSANLNIQGTGSSLLTVRRSTAGATPDFRIFTINAGKVVNISGLTITNGDQGGIRNEKGTLAINNCVVTANSGAAGVFNNGGTLTVNDSTVSNNTAGGIDNEAVFPVPPNPGFPAFLTVNNSTISANSSTGLFGGIQNLTASSSPPAIAIITNSTISGNSVTSTAGVGGIHNIAIVGGNPTVVVTNSTVYGNSSNGSSGTGGISNNTTSCVGACTRIIRLRNTIVVGNLLNGSSPSDISGAVDLNSLSNLIGTGGSGGLANGNNGNQVGVADAKLGPLTNNGGPTQTHALLPNSPAFDAGDPCVVNVTHCSESNTSRILTDQRGLARNVDGPDANTSLMVDIGAFEAQRQLADLPDSTINEDASLTVFFDPGDTSNITSVTASSSDGMLVPNDAAHLSASLSGSNASVVINPAADLFGTTNITITVNRSSASNDVKTFMLTVNSSNDAPSFTPGPAQIVNEDAGPQTVNNWATGISAGPVNESQVVNFQVTGNTNAALFSASPVISSTGTLTYTPVANANGSATITVKLQDFSGTANGGVDTSAPQTFTITVNPVNDPPSFITGSDQTVNEDTGSQTLINWATSISAGPANESQTLAFQITDNSNPGLFSAGPAISPTGTLTYTPAANANGSATITVVLKDSGGTANGGVDTSPAQTFMIGITSVNDVPSFTKGADQTVNEDAGGQSVTGWATAVSAGAANESGQTLAFQVTNNSNAALFSAGPAISSDGTLTYTPAADVTGSATITINLKDNGGTANGGVDTSANQSFSITVNSVNDAPSFIKGADQTVNEDSGAQTVSNWATAISPGPANESAQILTFTTTNNNNALFSVQPAISATGTLSYTPAANANGTATVSVTLKDNGGTANGGVDTSASQTFSIVINPAAGVISFASASSNTTESSGSVTVTVKRTGTFTKPATIDYVTSADNGSPCSNASGVATPKCDFTAALGTLSFAAGEDTKTITILISQDAFVEGPETLTVSLSNQTGGSALGTPATSTITIADDATEPPTNLIDDVRNFVRQHYHDFLNREPDQSGWDFWTNQITSCGSDVQCNEVRRIDVSASFFLSIEFQQTGYLVERFYKTGYGDGTGTSTFGGQHQLAVPIVRANEFLADTQRIGRGVVVLAPGWEQLLENNKQAYALEFVQAARFITAFPTTMTAAQFVDKLNQNAGNVLSANERTTAINLFGGATDSSNVTARAQAVRMVAEDTDLYNAEYNRAFVLAEYFGYLRRNPNDAPDSDYTGYDFWLTKLNQFNGNYINAEMVKAFLSSIEYRKRFGP